MFDYIFVTHLPAFYKINLYNELSKSLKICVIFIGKGSVIRTNDFTSGEVNFDYYFLSDNNFEKRNIFKCLIKLFLILKKLKFKKIVVGGWDLLEFWFIVILNKKVKNALVLESSVEDSSYLGIKGIIKKLFLSKINTVFASGLSQRRLLDKLKYNKLVYITKGVGIINKTQFIKNRHIFNNNFLYVGRLSEEKNLAVLINVFNELTQFNLNIVGSGHLEAELKKIAKANIKFINHVDNKKISETFLSNDVFILPSLSEPWGLVIEEAFYFGLPVIISNRVGCGLELVKNKENGIIFNVEVANELKDAITEISKKYNTYCDKVMKFNLEEKDREQVNCYIKALTVN